MTAKRTAERRRSPKTTSTAEFEALLRGVRQDQHYVLKLYITGTTPRSTQAITNIHALCEEFLPGRYALEVVDIYQQPDQAAGDQIIAAPTLVKSEPEPVKRLVGDLSNRERVLVALNLRSSPAAGNASTTHWVEL